MGKKSPKIFTNKSGQPGRFFTVFFYDFPYHICLFCLTKCNPAIPSKVQVHVCLFSDSVNLSPYLHFAHNRLIFCFFFPLCQWSKRTGARINLDFSIYMYNILQCIVANNLSNNNLWLQIIFPIIIHCWLSSIMHCWK